MAAEKTPDAAPKADPVAEQPKAPDAPVVEAPAPKPDASPKIEGGAVVTEVRLQPIAPEVAPGDDTVDVISTAPGTFGPGGIADVGTEAAIKVSAFSAAWMRPKSKADAKKIAAFLASKKAANLPA